MPSLLGKFLRHWPILILVLLELALFAANYSPNTYLIGWDNIMPEFNFREGFLRSIFGVWQEHRGLGFYDGMSHVANLLHTLFIWILSLALPISLLRYSFHFLMHLLGGLGAFFLMRHILQSKHYTLNTKLLSFIAS